MRRHLLAGLVLAGWSAALAGCSPAPSPRVQDRSSPGEPVAETVVRPAAEPELRYVPLDAPPGISQAVIVQGLPLVHTRQLLPLDSAGQLVGDNSLEEQTEQVLVNLSAVLESAGSGLNRLVKLNVYAVSPETAQQVREQVGNRLPPDVRPALTAVVTPLPHPGAILGLDAIATADERNSTAMDLLRCEAVAGDQARADTAILPRGGVVYLSGQAEKGPLAEATAKSLSALLEMLQQLGLGPAHVVQLKVFVQPAAAADEAANEVERLFSGQLVPPLVFVEWIASAPVEIELIAHLPLTGEESQSVHYYNPPGVQASPTFSRAALVQTERQIYISGLAGRAAGDGQAQVRDVFAQLSEILAQTGSDLRHLAKATYYVSDEDASTMLNKLRPEFFDPQRPPAASKASVHGVGHPDRTLSLDMIAVETR